MKCNRQRCIRLLLQMILLVTDCLAENLILNINIKRPIAVTSGAFLSLTLDPAALLNNNDALTKNNERSINMARGLVPAYVRLGGPRSNYYAFERTHANANLSDVFFEAHRTLLHQWADDAGLNVIACIAPRYIENETKTHLWELTNIEELLSFSDRMGYNASWQLGYECQTRCNFSGRDLGRYVAVLHETLKTFTRYSDSLIVGPDVVAYRTAQQQKYLQDYLNTTDAALSAITWHPNFASVTVNNDSISMHHDNMATEKDEMYKVIGRAAEKKPLWIAESKPEEGKHQYLGALIWTRRLGNAAKLGIQVIMRQHSDLGKATPDYWVSLLHKTLVGREVLEMRVQSNNESQVYFYSQCTKPSALYKKGAITIFGVNLTPRNVTTSIKGFKIKALHKYILLPGSKAGNKMFSEEVLLNNKKLNLINDKKLPDLNPEIITDHNGLELNLSPGGIGFWVIPNAKVKACMYRDEETTENTTMKKPSKQYENVIRRADRDEGQEEEEEEEEEEDISHPNLENRKIHAKQERRKRKNAENEKVEGLQKLWGVKLLAKLKRILLKKLQRREKSDPLYLRRSSTIFFKGEQESSFEEEERKNLDNKYFVEAEETGDKITNNDIRDTLIKYKRILLEKKIRAGRGDLKPETQNIDSIVALISKIIALLQLADDEKIASNEIINKIGKEEELMGINRKLKEKLDKLENDQEPRTNVTEKIEEYLNILYNLLEDNESIKNDGNNQILSHENLTNEKRNRRDLNKNLEDPKKDIFRKRFNLDDLKNQIKRKVKRRNNDTKRTSLIVSKLTNLDNNRSKLYDFLRRSPFKFLKDDTFVARHIDSQHSMQKHGRTKRDADRRSAEINLRKDIFRKRSRIDDVRNYMNERKTKQKDNLRKEGLLNPFSPRTDSNENNFYGFFRSDPIRGFPEGDVFVTTGNSRERSDQDYDYVEDDEADMKKKEAQQRQKSMFDHEEDDTWIEIDDDHCDYVPNEFFENVKLSNTRVKGDSKDYGDLYEAELLLKETHEHEDNNNGTIAVDIIQEQSPDKEKEEPVRERSMQKLVNNNSEEKGRDQSAKYEALKFFSRHSATPIDQPIETQVTKHDYTNRRRSNTRSIPKEAKLKMEPELKFITSLYQPAEAFATEYNYGNYQASTPSVRNDEAKLNEEFLKPVVYRSTNGRILHNRRSKRNDWKNLQKMFTIEMIEEDEDNARNCHRRIIRAPDLPKELNDHRVKRDSQITVAELAKFSSKARNSNAKLTTDYTRSKRNVQNPITQEKYDRIMAGDILPSTNQVIVTDINESGITTEIVTAESDRLDQRSNDATQTIDMSLTSVTPDPRINNISKRRHITEKPINEDVESSSRANTDSNDTIRHTTERTFFRTQSPGVPSKDEGTTYDPVKTTFNISSSSRETFIASTTKNVQEATCEKTQGFEKKEEAQLGSIYAVAEDQKNERQRHDDNYTVTSCDFSEGTTESIPNKQMTTETILSKRVMDKSIENLKSKESKSKRKSQRNMEDDRNTCGKSAIRPRTKEEKDLKRIKIITQDLSKAPLRELARYEEYLMRRNEQAEKLKEKLNVRRKNLLRQHRHDLMRVTDEQKRNLERRETWEKPCERDDFRQLIDQEKFARASSDDDDDDDGNDDDDNEKYVERCFPVDIVSKRFNSLEDRMYSQANVKRIYSPRRNPYHLFLRRLKVDEIEPESEEKSRSSDHKIFVIDPSTYHGGEPILQTVFATDFIEDNLEPPKSLSKLKSLTQIPKRTLRDFYQMLLGLEKTREDQVSRSPYENYYRRENIKKPSAVDSDEQENVIVFYVLDKQKRYNISRKAVGFSRVCLNSLDQQDINQIVTDKASNRLNDDDSDLPLRTTEKIINEGDVENEKYAGDKELANASNGTENILNIGKAENGKHSEEIVEDKNFDTDTEKMLNIRRPQDAESIKSEAQNNKEEDIVNDEVAKNAKVIDKSCRPNDEVKDNSSIETSDNNKEIRDVERIIVDNSKADELEKDDVRKKR